MSRSLRIAFAGTPEFAMPALRAMLDSGHEIVAVFTRPDRPAGRGRRLTPPPVKQAAVEAGVPVRQPGHLAVADLEAVAGPAGLDLLVVVAFGRILPREVLDYPRQGAINVHGSLLPRWRGAAPIARALLAGDDESGVSVIRMVPAMDAGPVLVEQRCAIADDETAATLHDRLAVLGAEALAKVLQDPPAYLAAAREQDPARVTYAAKLTRTEGRIDWSRPAESIARAVRALQPWPWARVALEDGPLRIHAAEVLPGRAPDEPPGTVLAVGHDGIDVATGDGVLRLLRVQPAGRRAMPAADFANARRLRGCRLDSD